MKKLLLSLLVFSAGLLASCSKDEATSENKEITKDPIKLVANSDVSSDTKTVLDNTQVKWCVDDPVMVFGEDKNGASKVSGYKALSGGATSASLGYDVSSGLPGTAFTAEENPQYALYPRDNSATISSGIITFTLPNEQTYVANSFGQSANFAVGKISKVSDSYNVNLKNVCGYLKLQLSVPEGNVASVGKIVLTTKGTEKLSGKFQANATSDAPVATYVSDGGSTITLNCPDGVSLSNTPTAFYFVVPVGAFSSGFKAEVYSTKGRPMQTLETTKDLAIARKTVKKMVNKSFNWLPSGYTEVSCITSTRASYFDTGYPVSENGYRMEFQMQITSTYLPSGVNNPSIFGGSYDNTWPNNFFYTSCDIKTSEGDNKLRLLYNSHFSGDIKYGKGQGVYEETSPFALNTLYHVDASLIRNKQALIINGESKTTHLIDEAVNSNTAPITVAFLANNKNNSYEGFYDANTYFCNMYNGSNVLVRQFIPAKNGSNVYGMYDVLNGAWYPSRTSTAFGGVD